MANLVAIQMTSTPNVEENMQFVEQQLQALSAERPCLVVLPECFACFGADDNKALEIAEEKGRGPVQQRLSSLAIEFDVWLVAGSFPLRCENQNKYTASCLLFNNLGEIVDEYQKIHLFDVQVSDNTGTYKESRFTQAGNSLSVLNTPFGHLGLAICYDIRFAAMFTAMSQIMPLDVLTLPAAFTQQTGLAHWQSLLSARAIENQCYLIAANQTGIHTNHRQTFGHSCIISPWGEMLANLAEDTGLIYTQINHNLLDEVRAKMPVHQHNQFRSHLV